VSENDITVNPIPEEYEPAKPLVLKETPLITKTDKHEFNYRLIKKGEYVKEERLPTDEAPAETIQGIRFLSSKAVFGPVTLLDTERQAKYHFRLVGHEKLQDRDTAVIEAVPVDEKDAQFVYGKMWIDAGDYSVLKIKANPNSILGYQKLRALADELNTRLYITLETEFYKFREGIRFPTRIRFEENYKGGAFITQQTGSRGWDRTKTMTEYIDYMFFNVDMDVVYEKEK
jgi:hypothetical protein